MLRYLCRDEEGHPAQRLLHRLIRERDGPLDSLTATLGAGRSI